MALTDPELDLLREMLVDSPSDDVFLEVGEELVRRLRFAEAEQVLSDGVHLVAAGEPRRAKAMSLLARASLETGRYELTAVSLGEIDTDVRREPEHARIEMLWLERSGQLDPARTQARRLLEVDPDDLVAQGVLERLDMPPPDPRLRAADPFYTVARVEKYVDVGRMDRAARVLRRVQLASMGDSHAVARLEQRLRQLTAEAAGARDDLSEELTDPGLISELPDLDAGELLPTVLPALAVPTPKVGSPLEPSDEDFEDEQLTDPAGVDPDVVEADFESTEILVATTADRGRTPSTAPTVVPASDGPASSLARDRRKRRSLLRR